MRKWSASSLAKRAQLTPRLAKALDFVLEHLFDLTILEGHRGEEAQNRAFTSGTSKVRWPDGKHNRLPSVAVDMQPYPMPRQTERTCRACGDVTMDDTLQREALSHVAGMIAGVYAAQNPGKSLRWGGNWDMDSDLADNKFDDLFHLEEVD